MTPAVANRAECPVPQRLKTQRQAASLTAGISTAQIVGDLPPSLAVLLSESRYRMRLERRFLRKSRVGDSCRDLLASPAEAIIAHGEHGLQALIIDTGIVCHYAALRRIVDAATLAELSAFLGIALNTHDVRLSKASDSLSLSHLIDAQSPIGVEPLAAAILQDGLQCWLCWIHRQPETLHEFFRQLTPPTLRVGGLPDHSGCTKRVCKHRAALFDIRHALVVEPDDMPVRKEA